MAKLLQKRKINLFLCQEGNFQIWPEQNLLTFLHFSAICQLKKSVSKSEFAHRRLSISIKIKATLGMHSVQ